MNALNRLEGPARAPMIDYAALVGDDRVSSRVYTDPHVFPDELARIWHRTWVYVGHESEIPSPGDYVTRTVGTQPVIVVRSTDGQVRVLFNRCPRCGNAVCQHPSRLDMQPVPRTGLYRGFTFCSLSQEGPTLEGHLGRSVRYIDAFTDHAPAGTIRVGAAGTLKTRYRGNWKMAFENACDSYHVLFVHRAVLDIFKSPGISLNRAYGDGSHFRTLDLSDGHGAVDFGEHNRQAGVAVFETGGAVPEDVEKDYRERLARRLGRERAEELIANGLGNVAIFPNLMLIGPSLRVIHPIGPSETIVEQIPTLLDGAPAEINHFRVRREYVNYSPAGLVGPDDQEMYERNQRGFQATGNEWLVLGRGLHREVVGRDGVVSAEASDETAQRGFFRHYRSLMTPQAR